MTWIALLLALLALLGTFGAKQLNVQTFWGWICVGFFVLLAAVMEINKRRKPKEKMADRKDPLYKGGGLGGIGRNAS